jgi:hypothetical protein
VPVDSYPRERMTNMATSSLLGHILPAKTPSQVQVSGVEIKHVG